VRDLNTDGLQLEIGTNRSHLIIQTTQRGIDFRTITISTEPLKYMPHRVSEACAADHHRELAGCVDIRKRPSEFETVEAIGEERWLTFPFLPDHVLISIDTSWITAYKIWHHQPWP
jgi:hypothetical protein